MIYNKYPRIIDQDGSDCFLRSVPWRQDPAWQLAQARKSPGASVASSWRSKGVLGLMTSQGVEEEESESEIADVDDL